MDSYNLIQEDLQPSLNIGCIGHVSHGKSSIVKALTGIGTAKFDDELVQQWYIIVVPITYYCCTNTWASSFNLNSPSLFIISSLIRSITLFIAIIPFTSSIVIV